MMLTYPLGIMLPEAIAAVNRTIAAWNEGDLGLLAAFRAGYIVHFALPTKTATAFLFASCSAPGTAAGFIGEPFLCKEILFRSRKNEFGAAIAAG